MADLNFDPLFDSSMPDNEKVGRKVERMPSSHKHDRFSENTHKARQIRDASFSFAAKLIGVIGIIVCAIVICVVAYFGWKAAGF